MKPEDFFSRRALKRWASSGFRSKKQIQPGDSSEQMPPDRLAKKIILGIGILSLLCCLCVLIILFIYLINAGILG